MTATRPPLKIVHLDTGRDLRGGQRQLLLLARGLRDSGHEQLIVCPEGSALEERARQEEFPLFTLPARDPGNAHGIVQLRQKLRGAHFEILHSHDGRAQTIAWLASLGGPERRVASRRVAFAPRRSLNFRLQYGRTCHRVIAVSGFVRQLLVQSGVREEKIEVIPDGVELPSELPGPETRSGLRAGWGFGDREFVVGHLGWFTPEKGQDLAIAAVLQLAKKNPWIRLLLAGDGPGRRSASLREQVGKAAGAIRLLGPLEDLTEFFPGLDLFLMPSRAEGLGSAALVAMAHGLPVVATRVGGLPEIVEEGGTGWLVPPDSPARMAEALAGAAADRSVLARLGGNARRRASQFSSAIMVARTEDLYERLRSG